MIKLISRKLFKCSSNKSARCAAASGGGAECRPHEIEWELRPGGMLVQKRERAAGYGSGRDNLLNQHGIPECGATIFGGLKASVGMETGVEPREQRLLLREKEKDGGDHLHIAGVKEGDKVLLLEDPAINERKLQGIGTAFQALESEASGSSILQV